MPKECIAFVTAAAAIPFPTQTLGEEKTKDSLETPDRPEGYVLVSVTVGAVDALLSDDKNLKPTERRQRLDVRLKGLIVSILKDEL